LDHIFPSIQNIFNGASQKNSTSLRKSLRLYNISSCFSFINTLEILPELRKLHWHYPSIWKKIILVRKLSFHGHQMKPQQIFSCQNVNSREMIDLLIKVHFKKGIWLNLPICPPYVPITYSFLILYNPPKTLCNLFYYWILSITNIDNYLFLFKFFR